MNYWKKWRYKNLTIFFTSILVVVFLSRFGFFKELVDRLGELGYIGAFFAGVLFVSTFTVAFGSVLLFRLAESLTAWEVGLVAGLGGVLGDFLIFKLVRSGLVKEVKPIYDQFGGRELTKILHTKYFSWTLPVIGAAIIASPFPDELGVTLLGISKMPTWQFLLIALVLDVIGVFLVVSAATLF